MKIRLALLAAVSLSLLAVPIGSAVPPVVMGDAGLGIVSGNNLIPVPPNQPKVGDTLESTWATFACDPGCDPNQPDANPSVGNKEIHPSAYGPPVGFSMAWERCTTTATSSCKVVRERSYDRSSNRYQITDADVGAMIRSAVYATNLDCGYPRSYDQHQDCRYETRGVYSKLTGRIPALAAVAIGPAALPEGAAGQPYEFALTATTGTGHSFSVASGSLPPGMTLSPSGALSGTPTLGGAYTFTVRATATGAAAGQKTYTLQIKLPLANATLPAGTVGGQYSAQLAAPAASTAPITWKFISGKLAAGLAFAPGGTVSGRPTEVGTFSFVAEATDAKGGRGTATYTLTIGYPTLTLASSRLPDARQGVRFRFQVSPEGGTLPYTFTLASGKLPKGVNFGAKGLVWGKPQVSGIFRWHASVKDAFGAQQTFTLELRIKKAVKKAVGRR